MYSHDSQKIATYFTTLYYPPEMDTKEFNAFKKKIVNFKIQNKHFFCHNSKNVPICRVVDDLVERQNILQ